MNWYKNLKMKVKLILGFSIVCFLTLVVVALAANDIQSINKANARLYDEGVMDYAYAAEINEAFAELRSSVRDMVIETNPERLQRFKANFDRWRGVISDNQKKLAEAVKNFPQRRKMVEEMEASMQMFYQNVEVAVENALAGRKTEAWTNMNDGNLFRARQDFGKAADALRDFMLNNATELSAQNSTLAKRSAVAAITVALIVVVASIIIGILIAKIVNNLNRLAVNIGKVANGDLTVVPKALYTNKLGKIRDNPGHMVSESR